MPQIGDIKEARDIGRCGANGRAKYIWHACVDCGKERWVVLTHGQPKSQRCHSCNIKGERHQQWKGGRHKTTDGYIEVWLSPNDFFSPTANKDGYIKEHRLMMARHLGRNLHQWEIVHHKNHIKDDNQIKNLQLVSADKHNKITLMEARIAKLESEVRLLKWRLKESGLYASAK